MDYYNDSDPFCAEWLGNLIRAKLIPDGVVDSRPIQEVQASDLASFVQCHFFAGIGGWPLALQLAGWPPGERVWTGSCPCQPFSPAGKRQGTGDPRHLWPEFLRLISLGGPPVVFGEQVASAAGREWLSRVRSDLEALAYAVGAADLCAAGVGAPHIRQRLWWVALSHGRLPGDGDLQRSREQRFQPPDGSPGERVALSNDAIRGAEMASGDFLNRADSRWPGTHGEPGVGRPPGRVGNSEHSERGSELQEDCNSLRWNGSGGHGDLSAWSDFILLPCLDGKARRAEPGIFPLAHGVPARVGKLRALGNAIVPQVAAEFIRAFLETSDGR